MGKNVAGTENAVRFVIIPQNPSKLLLERYYRKKYVRTLGISDGAGTYFRGPYLLSGGMIRRDEKSSKEEVCSIWCFP